MTKRISVGDWSRREPAWVTRNVERLISELFGASSIYELLCARAAKCDVARADFTALAPHPELNRCLGRLVDIARELRVSADASVLNTSELYADARTLRA